jgi:hypothetical protein
LPWRLLACGLRQPSRSRPPRSHELRGSFPHPTGSLCTLRPRRYRAHPQHSLPGGSLGPCRAGPSPQDRADFAQRTAASPGISTSRGSRAIWRLPSSQTGRRSGRYRRRAPAASRPRGALPKPRSRTSLAAMRRICRRPFLSAATALAGLRASRHPIGSNRSKGLSKVNDAVATTIDPIAPSDERRPMTA